MIFHDDRLEQIHVFHFQDFDQGKVVDQYLDDGIYGIGDKFHWECAQFHGIAQIVDIGGTESEQPNARRRYGIKKIS